MNVNSSNSKLSNKYNNKTKTPDIHHFYSIPSLYYYNSYLYILFLFTTNKKIRKNKQFIFMTHCECLNDILLMKQKIMNDYDCKLSLVTWVFVLVAIYSWSLFLILLILISACFLAFYLVFLMIFLVFIPSMAFNFFIEMNFYGVFMFF